MGERLLLGIFQLYHDENIYIRKIWWGVWLCTILKRVVWFIYCKFS